ncbi:hypothetical protein [Streptomyces sp. NPDC002403]
MRVQVALCRAHDRAAQSVIGHREWSSDKVDPRGIGMAQFRADVAERLKHPANWSPGCSTAPGKDDPMALRGACIKKVAAAVVEQLLSDHVDPIQGRRPARTVPRGHMDAAVLTALGALPAGPVAAVAAIYGSRGAARATREGGALTGFNSLTDQLQEERKELLSEPATLRVDLAAERAEGARLRLLVTQLGGTP